MMYLFNDDMLDAALARFAEARLAAGLKPATLDFCRMAVHAFFRSPEAARLLTTGTAATPALPEVEELLAEEILLHAEDELTEHAA